MPWRNLPQPLSPPPGSPRARKRLERRTPLKRQIRHLQIIDAPGRAEWKARQAGYCECGCARFSLHLHRHHVLLERVVREHNGDPWDLANSMLLHEHCHRRHHDAFRRIPQAAIPAAAQKFMVDLLGEDLASLYVTRYYSTDRHLSPEAS